MKIARWGWLGRLASFGLLAAAVVVALAGCSDTREKPVDVDAGGHRLHLLVVGTARQKPAVVLESGAGGRIGWEKTRNQIAQFAQVVTYDRAGFGNSEPGPLPRDARTIAVELHAALHSARVAPPYVLVGQSLGGIYVQVFAAMYPDETAGLVLVDSTHASADLCLSTDEVKAWFMTHQPDDWPRVEAGCRNAQGGLRGFLACKYKLMESYIESVPAPRRSALRGAWWGLIEKVLGKNEPSAVPDLEHEETKVMTDSIRQAIAARPLPKVPTILLAAGKTDLDIVPANELTSDVLALQAEARRWKMADYGKWIEATPGAKLEIVDGSGHDIESDRPQAVVDAVRDVLRGK
uniref:Alpha/beta hydrolase fold protein n=1 Tax=uncultured bacterium AOCefta2 TaxID=654977 RepID=D6MLX2_9BACT|nr:alpha/beta hydrolase fold protein [uncultured bacterium AOCefta2]